MISLNPNPGDLPSPDGSLARFSPVWRAKARTPVSGRARRRCSSALFLWSYILLVETVHVLRDLVEVIFDREVTSVEPVEFGLWQILEK